jgi:drug/metabolite transporter (DMT)-like permease
MLVPPSSGSGHSKEDDEEDEDEDASSDHQYLSSPYWWLGLILMSIGESGNFLAYGFAPASIVSPLGVVALISNCVIAPLLLKEPFRRRDLLGVILSICGAVTIVLSAEKSQPRLTPDDLLSAISQPAFLVYLLTTCVLFAVLASLSTPYGHKYILLDLALAALLGAYTVLCTKAISSLLSSSLYRTFTYPLTYPLLAILAITAVLQVKYVNRALMRFDATLVVPTQFVLFTLSVVVGSAVMYRDFERVGQDGVVRFVVGCVVTFCGVWVVSSERAVGGEEEVEGVEGEGLRRRRLSSGEGTIVGYSLRAVAPVMRDEI